MNWLSTSARQPDYCVLRSCANVVIVATRFCIAAFRRGDTIDTIAVRAASDVELAEVSHDEAVISICRLLLA